MHKPVRLFFWAALPILLALIIYRQDRVYAGHSTEVLYIITSALRTVAPLTPNTCLVTADFVSGLSQTRFVLCTPLNSTHGVPLTCIHQPTLVHVQEDQYGLGFKAVSVQDSNGRVYVVRGAAASCVHRKLFRDIAVDEQDHLSENDESASESESEAETPPPTATPTPTPTPSRSPRRRRKRRHTKA